MNITYTPPETKVVEVAPASLTLTVTPEQFAKLRALVGQVNVGQLGNVFNEMEASMKAHKIPRYSVVNESSIPGIKFKESK